MKQVWQTNALLLQHQGLANHLVRCSGLALGEVNVTDHDAIALPVSYDVHMGSGEPFATRNFHLLIVGQMDARGAVSRFEFFLAN